MRTLVLVVGLTLGVALFGHSLADAGVAAVLRAPLADTAATASLVLALLWFAGCVAVRWLPGAAVACFAVAAAYAAWLAATAPALVLAPWGGAAAVLALLGLGAVAERRRDDWNERAVRVQRRVIDGRLVGFELERITREERQASAVAEGDDGGLAWKEPGRGW